MSVSSAAAASVAMGLCMLGCAAKDLGRANRSESSVEEAVARLEHANVIVVGLQPGMLGSRLLVNRAHWGPYFLPSDDAFLFILRRGQCVEAYALAGRADLSQLIVTQRSGVVQRRAYPCYPTLAVAGESVEGQGERTAMIVTVPQGGPLPGADTRRDVVLRRGVTISSVLARLSLADEATLILEHFDLSLSSELPFWGPYFLPSHGVYIVVLRNGKRARGYALVDEQSLDRLSIDLSIGLDAVGEFPYYSTVSITKSGVEGKGKLGVIRVEATEWGVSAPVDSELLRG